MGCCCPPKEPQDDLISDRSVDLETENPTHHHSLNTTASCGYGFDLDTFLVSQLQENKQREHQTELYEQYEELYMQIRRQFKEHDIDECMEMVVRLREMEAQLNYSYLDVTQPEQDEIHAYIQQIEDRYKEMLHYAGFLQPEGWVGQGESEGIKLFSRRDSGTLGILMESIVEMPVEIFLTVMADTQLYDQLIPSVKKSREEKHIDRNHKIGYCLFDLPLLSDRQAIFQGVGYNRLSHNKTILIYSHSIHNRKDICERLGFVPRTNGERVQIDYKYLLIQYEPTGFQRGKVSVALDIDMKLNFLPNALLEMMCKKFCRDFFWVVLEASGKFEGSVWQSKVRRQPQTFSFFRDTISNYYDKHNIQ